MEYILIKIISSIQSVKLNNTQPSKRVVPFLCLLIFLGLAQEPSLSLSILKLWNMKQCYGKIEKVETVEKV
jgi:hypothetical protein